MEIKLIHALVRIMRRADLTELEIDDSSAGLRVRLKRGHGSEGGTPLVNVMQGPAAAPAGPSTGAPAAPAAPAPSGSGEPALPPGVVAFTSPMVGTFYRSPSPDAAPFVDVGGKFTEDTVICIVEAMKVMNEIRPEFRGEIVEVLVENAEPVEFGQPLFLVRKG
ncbi:MAG: acetyl-CoA carboxylase biotin carboxyl carrier protein [Planctomycetota bacterium]